MEGSCTSTTNWTRQLRQRHPHVHRRRVGPDARYFGFYEADNTSVDHNLYVRANKIFASNYLSGLRVSERPQRQFDPYPTSTPTPTQIL